MQLSSLKNLLSPEASGLHMSWSYMLWCELKALGALLSLERVCVVYRSLGFAVY